MLLTAVASAGLAAERRHWMGAGLLIVALAQPWAAATAIVGLLAIASRQRRLGSADEATYLQAVALELRAGGTLRQAVTAAADRAPGLDLGACLRLANAGAPMDAVGARMAAALPHHGHEISAAMHVAAVTGGTVASVFESLAQVAVEDRELARERRAATAHARISAWLVGGLPVAFLGFNLVTGRLGRLVESTAGGLMLAVGLALVLSGSLAVGLMLRRSLR